MNKQSTKSDLISSIKCAAKLYKENLVGKSFLYVFDNRCIEVSYRSRDFLHMTGVNYKGSAEQFFKDAIRGRLMTTHIGFSKRHPYFLCEKKISRLKDFCSIVDSDLLILEDVTTNTFVYKFGVTDLEFTVCLSEDRNRDGKIASDHFIVRSLRVEDSFARAENAHAVQFIFAKANGQRLYDTVTFAEKDARIADLPEGVRLYLHDSLLEEG